MSIEITWTDKEKSLVKVQHSFLIKSLKKLGIERMYHDLIKAAYHKPVDNTILNEEKLQPFPLKISMWQECSLERWYKKVLKALNCSSMTREKTGQKRKRVKLPLFRWYILFLKHCKAHKRKLWELISTFSRIVE